jgi:adenylosuccinate synthase
MPVRIILGAQWGDEGKGKLVDVLASESDYVIRYQGGANAGHTVYINDKKYVLHLLPSGILTPGIQCILGNGMVIDPDAFFDELDFLEKNKIDYKNRILISNRAHLIFPYHKIFDQLSEKKLDNNKIGTTGRGIGPAYVDKYNRKGIRITDLYSDDILKQRLEKNVNYFNKILVEQYYQQPLNFQDLLDKTKLIAKQFEPYVVDTSKIVFDAWKSEKSLLLEGAQGSLLDVDFGTYPYVTSSNPVSGGASTGTGLPPTAIKNVIGVMKAYITRVGEGPFPTEENSKVGEKLRKEGNEFGATTGRPRRCGWFDAIAAQYSARINGLTSIALTKLDVLDTFDEIKICTSYECNGKRVDNFPASLQVLKQCKPIYESFPGWKENISEINNFEDLPKNTKNYIQAIEKYCGIPAKYISVGVNRRQIIRQ